MKIFYIISIVIVILVFGAYIFSKSSNKAEISIGELVEWMDSKEEIVILDVRNPEEFAGKLGHIKGVINIPIHKLGKRIAMLNDYKEKKIAVICRSGNRSQYGTATLIQNGFDAYNVKGGMRAYRKVIGKEL